MFDAHVPDAVPRSGAACRRSTPDGSQQWYYGEIRGRNLGLNAVAGKPPEMFNVNPTRYEDMRPGCYDVDERVRDMSAGGQLAGLELPELDRLLGPGAQRGSRPRRQPGDDPGLQRLARRRVVRRAPRPVHPVRDPAAVRRRARPRRRCAASRRRAATRSRSRRTPPGSACRASTPARGTRCSPRAATTGTVLCCHVGSSSKSASTTPDAPAAGADEPVVGDVDLHARRPAVGRLLAPLPRRCGSRSPRATSAGSRTSCSAPSTRSSRHNGWMGHELPQGMRPDRAVPRAHPRAASSTTAIGVKLLDEFNVDNVCWESDYPHSDSSWPDAPERLEELFAGARRRRS